jgi:hypothetical protein
MFSAAVCKHARVALYALLGVLLVLEAFWNVHRVSSTAQLYDDDDVQVSAARRLPRAVGVEDAIY